MGGGKPVRREEERQGGGGGGVPMVFIEGVVLRGAVLSRMQATGGERATVLQRHRVTGPTGFRRATRRTTAGNRRTESQRHRPRATESNALSAFWGH